MGPAPEPLSVVSVGRQRHRTTSTPAASTGGSQDMSCAPCAPAAPRAGGGAAAGGGKRVTKKRRLTSKTKQEVTGALYALCCSPALRALEVIDHGAVLCLPPVAQRRPYSIALPMQLSCDSHRPGSSAAEGRHARRRALPALQRRGQGRSAARRRGAFPPAPTPVFT
jgi:hypothetical protein